MKRLNKHRIIISAALAGLVLSNYIILRYNPFGILTETVVSRELVTPLDTNEDGKYDSVRITSYRLDENSKELKQVDTKQKKLEDLTEEEAKRLKIDKQTGKYKN